MSKKITYVCVGTYDAAAGVSDTLQGAFDDYVSNHGEPDDFDNVDFYKAEKIEVERKIQLKSETKVTEVR